jgi:uncharacterized protein YkwD
MHIVIRLLVRKGKQNALERFTFPSALAALTVALLLIALLNGPRARAQDGLACPDADRAPREASLRFLRSSVLCLVNRARLHYGLRPLRFNPALRKSAIRHSNEMVANGYFSHYGPGGSTVGDRVWRSGYLARVNVYLVGENIGGGLGRRFGSPMAVYRSWMHSPGHRANILDPGFHDIGVGVARGYPYGGGANAATYTLDLGMRR